MDVQNNNISIQIHAKDLQGRPLRVADCDLFILHVFTDNPSFYLTFSGRDTLATEWVDEITISKRDMEHLASGVVQYTYHYLPKTESNRPEPPIVDDVECPHDDFPRHKHPHHPNDFRDDDLINSKPVVTSIYWRNLSMKPNHRPENGVNMNDLDRLHRLLDVEIHNRIKADEEINSKIDESFSDKLQEEIERSVAEDERLNALIAELQIKSDEIIDNSGSNKEETDNKIEETDNRVEDEILRAKKAESELENAIKAEEATRIASDEVLETKITMEKERATANEQNINDRLVSLTDRFEANKELTTETIKSEIERAKAVESGLNSLIQNVTDNLNAEISRGSQKDIEHQNLVETEANRAQAVENKIATDLETEVIRSKDAEKHLWDEVHSVQDTVSNLATATNVYTKSEVDNKINSVKNDVDTINNWVNNHNNDVDALNTKVNGLVADVDKAKSDILAEVAKCDAENNKLSTDIQTLSDSTYTKAETDNFVNDLSNSISSLENWKNNHSDNTEGLTEKVNKAVSDVEKLNTDLSNETTARINADLTLQTKVDVAEGKVDAEVERAKAQEKLISDELKDVKDNATSKHSELSDSIGEVSANLTLEIAERKAQDKVLSDALEIVNGDVETNGSIKKSLADSKAYTDAEIAKLSLQKDSEIADTLKSYATNESVDKKISDVIGTAPEALDTLGKLSNALSQDSDAITAINGVLEGKANSEDVYTKSEIDSQVTAINNALATETTARENADSTLNGRIDDLVAKVNANENANSDAVTALQTAISNEETARKAQDKAISDKLDSEVEKLSDKVTELNAKVIQDIADSSAKDVELEASISATNTLLSNVEKKVDDEVLRATEKDNELVAKDTALEAKIDANTLAIQNEVNRSKQVQKELNDKINGLDLDGANTSISALNDKVDSEISAREASDKVHSDAIAVLQTSVTSLTDSVNAQSAKDIEIDAKIDNVQSTLQTAIENEAKTARASEKANEDAIKALSEKVDAIEIPTVDFTEVNSAISTLETKVDNEVSRAKNAEKINSDNIASLQSSVSSLNDSVTSVSTEITQFKADSNAKDTELQTAIDVINGDKETIGSIAHSVEEAKHYADETFQPKGDYLTEHQDISNLATKAELSNVEAKIPSLEGYAKESDVDKKIADVVNGAPEQFDTLKEIADALKNNDDAVSSIVSTLATKANADEVYNKNDVDTKETAINNAISTLDTKVDNEVSKLQTAIEVHKNEADSKYLTSHQDISHLATKNELENSLSSKANKSDVYTKSEVDSAIANVDVTEQLEDYVKVDDNTVIKDQNGKVIKSLILDLSDEGENGIPVYNKNEVDAKFATKTELQEAIDAIQIGIGDDVDLSDYYTKDEIDSMIPSSVDLSGYATRAELETLGNQLVDVADDVALKANSSDVYDKAYIDGVVTSVNSSLNSKLPIDSFNEWSEGVATKEYVDGKVDAIEIPSFDDVYSKEEADAKFAQFWSGTQDEYDALAEINNNTIYIITE